MIKKTIERLIKHDNLSSLECEDVLRYIIDNEDLINASAFLVLLKAKGETAEEIYGIAKAMKTQMIKVETSCPVMDIVGTGGDGMNTFNISTASSLIAASCGVKIAKHGNRSISSLCGSADFLEALGIDINKNPQQTKESIEENGFGFMFAPNYHPAMAKIAPARKALGIPTCFNIIGPLLNPASAKYMMVGVYKEELLDVVADVLRMFKVRKALVYHGCGTDEITTAGASKAIQISDEDILSTWIKPDDFGFEKSNLKDLKGGNSYENAGIFNTILSGIQSVYSDTAIFNASIALTIFDSHINIEDAITIIKEALKSSHTKQFVERLSTSYQQA